MRKGFVLVASAAVCLFTQVAYAQTWNDFFKAVGKELEKEGQRMVDESVQRADDGCKSKESNARVETVDETQRPSWVVTSSNGDTFQLRTLGIQAAVDNSNMSLMDYLSASESAGFSMLGSDNPLVYRYRVSLSYRNVGDTGDRTIGGMLAVAAASTLQQRLPREIYSNVIGVGGEALTGGPWCMSLLSSNLSSIRYLAVQ